MSKLQKKYWFINSLFVKVLLFLVPCDVVAQSSFLYIGNSLNAYYIIEDNFGGLMGLTMDKMIRVNSKGRLLWETSNSGLAYRGFSLKDSQNYVFSGASSEFGGYRLISYDSRGNVFWDNFNSSEPEASSIASIIIDSNRRQYVVAGIKFKVGVQNKSKYWIAGVDYRGNIIWENSWRDSGQSKFFSRIFKNPKTKGYILLSNDDNKYRIAAELINVDSMGKLVNIRPIEPNPCVIEPHSFDYELKGITSYNDSFLIATVKVDTDCPAASWFLFLHLQS